VVAAAVTKTAALRSRGTGQRGVAATLIMAKELELERSSLPDPVFLIKLPALIAYIGDFWGQFALLLITGLATQLPIAARQRLCWVTSIKLHRAARITRLLRQPLPCSSAMPTLAAVLEFAFSCLGYEVRRQACCFYASGKAGIAVLTKVLAERSASPFPPWIAVFLFVPLIRTAHRANGFAPKRLGAIVSVISIECLKWPLNQATSADLALTAESEIVCLIGHRSPARHSRRGRGYTTIRTA
jgi:hypothetical protein